MAANVISKWTEKVGGYRNTFVDIHDASKQLEQDGLAKYGGLAKKLNLLVGSDKIERIIHGATVIKADTEARARDTDLMLGGPIKIESKELNCRWVKHAVLCTDRTDKITIKNEWMYDTDLVNMEVEFDDPYNGAYIVFKGCKVEFKGGAVLRSAVFKDCEVTIHGGCGINKCEFWDSEVCII